MEATDCPSIYQIPEAFYKQGVDKLVMKMLNLTPKKEFDTSWFDIVKKELTKTTRIAVIGKYTGMKDAYKSIAESLYLAGLHQGVKVEDVYFEAEDTDLINKIKGFDGILIPGGYGYRGVEGKISAITYARENNIPFFGICLGMQCAVIEAARNLAGIKDATSGEFDSNAKEQVIAMLNEQRTIVNIGGTQRVGEYSAKIKKDTLAYKLYGKEDIVERHRHRYEFNPEYAERLEKAGLKISAFHDKLPEIVEIESHPFFIGCQFHPEFASSVDRPHPVFAGFVEACVKNHK